MRILLLAFTLLYSATPLHSFEGFAVVKHSKLPPIKTETRACKIVKAAKAYGIPPNIALTVVKVESGFNPRANRYEPHIHKGKYTRWDATSHGLFQVMGFNARHYGVLGDKIYDEDTNCEIGLTMLKKFLDATGSMRHALKRFNGTYKYADKVLKESNNVSPLSERC